MGGRGAPPPPVDMGAYFLTVGDLKLDVQMIFVDVSNVHLVKGKKGTFSIVLFFKREERDISYLVLRSNIGC